MAVSYSRQYPYGFVPDEPEDVDYLAAATPRSAAYSRIRNESDPKNAAAQDRIYAYERGAELDQGYAGDQDRANFERDYFGTGLKGAYDPLIAGQGGLSPDDLQNVTRQDELDALGMTPDEIANSYLSMDERLAIQGDTARRSKYFNPNYENDLHTQGAARERAAGDSYTKSLNEAFDPATLRPDAGFTEGLNRGVSNFSSSVDAALNPDGLTVSEDFLRDYQLTPQQQQDMVTSAAATVGTRDKAAIGELERRARAAGINPLGVAAMRQKMERESSANAADAATNARVATSAEAARRMQTGEAMRLNAGQQYAGMKVNAAGDVLDAGYRAGTTAEQARVGGERDIADRRTFAADRSGQAAMGRESDLSRRGLDLQQSITARGNEAERDADSTAVDRMKFLSTNRLGNEQYVQGQRYGRGAAASDRLSDRYRYATDAKRADAQEGRGYYREAQNQANSNYNAGADRRAGIYGTQVGAGQAATRTQSQIEEADKNRPKWYDKLISAGSRAAASYFGGGAKGGVITKPTYALLGEDGPEMVVPMGADNPEVLPSMAVRPGQPMPFQTAPPPPKFKAAYSQQYRYGS